jgi:hypothetical protein
LNCCSQLPPFAISISKFRFRHLEFVAATSDGEDAHATDGLST